MDKSKIFTIAEVEEIERRKNKDYSDKQGLFASRIRPKILELLNVWFPKKDELEHLIKSKRKKVVDDGRNER